MCPCSVGEGAVGSVGVSGGGGIATIVASWDGVGMGADVCHLLGGVSNWGSVGVGHGSSWGSDGVVSGGSDGNWGSDSNWGGGNGNGLDVHIGLSGDLGVHVGLGSDLLVNVGLSSGRDLA